MRTSSSPFVTGSKFPKNAIPSSFAKASGADEESASKIDPLAVKGSRRSRVELHSLHDFDWARGTDPVQFLAARAKVAPEEAARIWKRATEASADDPPRGDELATIRDLGAMLAKALETG